VQASKQERGALKASFDELQYSYIEETDNPAYQMFLGGA
jgi:threonine dehydratase